MKTEIKVTFNGEDAVELTMPTMSKATGTAWATKVMSNGGFKIKESNGSLSFYPLHTIKMIEVYEVKPTSKRKPKPKPTTESSTTK